jgi:predicted DNA-binding transcriptional regulator AlpA
MVLTMSTAASRRTVYLIPIGLSREQAADYISVGTTLFDTLVEDGRMPAPRAINGRNVWDREEIEACFKALPYHGSKKAKRPSSDWSKIT